MDVFHLSGTFCLSTRKKTVKASIIAVAIQKLIPTQSLVARAVASALTVWVPNSRVTAKIPRVAFVILLRFLYGFESMHMRTSLRI